RSEGLQSGYVSVLATSGNDHRQLIAGTFRAGGVSFLQLDTPIADVNADGRIDVQDIFYLINHLFAGGPSPPRTPDVNRDGVVDVKDVFFLIDYLFAGGPAPSVSWL